MTMSKLESLHEGPAESSGLSREEIARRAYQLWEERGSPHGSPEEDWYRAEHQLRQSSETHGHTPAASQETAE